MPELLDPVAKKRPRDQQPNCAVVAGSRCPNRPFFEDLVLSIGGVEVKRFRCPCEQTKLLEVFHSLGWPEFIRQPFGVPSELDPKHGFRDIVYELNEEQKDLPLRVHFRCDAGGVGWEIVDERPERQ